MSMQSLSLASVNLILGDAEKNEEFRSFASDIYRKSTFQNALDETELLRAMKKERKKQATGATDEEQKRDRDKREASKEQHINSKTVNQFII